MRICILTIAVAALTAACGRPDKIDPSLDKLGRATGPVEPSNKSTTLPPGHPPVGKGEGAMQPGTATPNETGATHVGVALETIDVPNYTYVRFRDDSNEERWAALPSAKIAVGDKIRIAESMTMQNFRSPSLDRVFPVIIFGTLKAEVAVPSNADPNASAP